MPMRVRADALLEREKWHAYGFPARRIARDTLQKLSINIYIGGVYNAPAICMPCNCNILDAIIAKPSSNNITNIDFHEERKKINSTIKLSRDYY